MILAAFCAAILCQAEDPTLATVTVVFDDGRGNCWTNSQVVAVPKSGYSINDVAYIGTVTAIRPDAVTEWQAMLQKVEVLWEEYGKRMARHERSAKMRAEARKRAASAVPVRKRVNELNAILKNRYPEKKK
jgi:hypothetical protein